MAGRGGLLQAAREVATARSGCVSVRGSGDPLVSVDADLLVDVDAVEPADLLAAGPKVLLLLLTGPAVVEGAGATGVAGEAVDMVEAATLEGVAAAAEMLAGWLREALSEARGAEAGGGACSTFTFCTSCGFTLPCPWGC